MKLQKKIYDPMKIFQIIEERRLELQNQPKDCLVDDEFIKKRMNTLDQILTAQKSDGTTFSNMDLIYQLFTIISAVSYFEKFYNLCSQEHPSINRPTILRH